MRKLRSNVNFTLKEVIIKTYLSYIIDISNWQIQRRGFGRMKTAYYKYGKRLETYHNNL